MCVCTCTAVGIYTYFLSRMYSKETLYVLQGGKGVILEEYAVRKYFKKLSVKKQHKVEEEIEHVLNCDPEKVKLPVEVSEETAYLLSRYTGA